MSDLGGEIEQRRNHASCGKQLRNRAERLEIRTRALANQRQNDDVDLSVVKILLLMPDHLQMMVAFQATQTSQNSFAISKAVLRRSQESIGSEIFFDHRLRHDESEAEKFEYIRRNPVRAGLIRAEDEWPCVLFGESSGG